MKDNERLFYWMGQRDMLAVVLTETKDKIKLPEQAKFYKKAFKEEHFSHKWHTII
jgi:hypothetical protein